MFSIISRPFRFSQTLLLFVAAVVCSSIAVTGVYGQTKSAAEGDLFHNEDCTNFFYYKKFSDGNAAATIERFVDVMADAGVTTYLCNTNARRTNYDSSVWNSFWEGYDPDGPDDQPFLRSIEKESVGKYRQLVGNMLALHEQGIDFPSAVIKRCRERAISPWITLRMNDCHLNTQLNHPFHGDFWRNKPQFIRKNATGYFANCLDYAHPEVRDYFMALIVETLDRFDIDGLELDFMREPYLFSVGEEKEGERLLTAWIGQVRKKIDAAAIKRGHPIRFGVRVPSHPDTAKRLGMDSIAWAKSGWIDVLVPTPRWATLEFDMPLVEWRAALEGTKTKLLGGLEVRYQPCYTAAAATVTSEMATAAAVSVLSRGADAVYLFNYFQDGHPAWNPDVFQTTLRAMKSLDVLLEKPRRYCVSYRDIIGPGEAYHPPLPKSGNEIHFSLSTGPISNHRISRDEVVCELLIGLPIARETPLPAPSIEINGKSCKLLSDTTPDKPAKNAERTITYLVSSEALKPSGFQEVKISAKDSVPITIQRVEMLIEN